MFDSNVTPGESRNSNNLIMYQTQQDSVQNLPEAALDANKMKSSSPKLISGSKKVLKIG